MEKSIIIRYHNSEVKVVLRPIPEGYDLVDVILVSGTLPDTTHLRGGTFPDIGSVRRAIIAAMKGPVGDTLDNVLLSEQAIIAWNRAINNARPRIQALSPPDIESIGDERAEALADGSLRIWVDLPDGPVEVAIPKQQWAWRTHPN